MPLPAHSALFRSEVATASCVAIAAPRWPACARGSACPRRRGTCRSTAAMSPITRPGRDLAVALVGRRRRRGLCRPPARCGLALRRLRGFRRTVAELPLACRLSGGPLREGRAASAQGLAGLADQEAAYFGIRPVRARTRPSASGSATALRPVRDAPCRGRGHLPHAVGGPPRDPHAARRRFTPTTGGWRSSTGQPQTPFNLRMERRPPLARTTRTSAHWSPPPIWAGSFGAKTFTRIEAISGAGPQDLASDTFVL